MVRALGMIKNGKSTEPDEIPIEAWKTLGEEGIGILWDFMERLYGQEVIPEEWGHGTLVPVFKEKGEVQNCGNYRGMKLISHPLQGDTE